MKKHIFLRVMSLSIIASMCLTACGGSGNSNSSDNGNNVSADSSEKEQPTDNKAAADDEEANKSSSACVTVKLDPKNPVALNIWHYYNGMQQQSFSKMVSDFNDTVGVEEGIVVQEYSKGDVNGLGEAVLASANHEVGADEMPDIFATYADTAYALEKQDILTDISQYFSEEELNEYVPSFIEEGRLNLDKGLYVFPVAKSTEELVINQTAWDEFSEETGADITELSTWEGIVKVSKAYYEWTDAKTPDIENDGSAFYGRDAFANFMLVGCYQLGHPIFSLENGEVTIDIDKDTIRKLWDTEYVPLVNGWFGSYGRFRSDDIKTGQLIASVGSTSGAFYYPNEVTYSDGSTEPIECKAYLLPNFEGTTPCAVQQGAGMAVTKSTPEKEYAAAVFLKWFTEAQNNASFSTGSGYLPVKKEANSNDYIQQTIKDNNVSDSVSNILSVGAEIVSDYDLFVSPAFDDSMSARKVLEYNMPDAAAAAIAERDELIAGGMARDEAVESLTNDDAFEKWYADFNSAFDAYR